jgi:hypothetical protein
LPYEEAIKVYAAKNIEKKVLQFCVRQLSNKNIILFFWIL